MSGGRTEDCRRDRKRIDAISYSAFLAGIALIAIGSIMDLLWVVVAGFACFLFIPYLFLRTYQLEREHRSITATKWGYARLSFAPFAPVLLVAAVTIAVIYASADATGPLIFAYFNVISMFFILLLFLFPQILVLSYGATRIKDGEMLARISAIAKKLGVESVKTYILPWKSIRAANALETGASFNRSIFISDYLFEEMSPKEVDAVIAHELGHAKSRHVLKKLAVVGPLIFAEINLLAYYFMVQDLFAMAIFLGFVIVCALLLLLFVMPLSRQYEFEADRMAVDALGDPAPVASALIKLHQLNEVGGSSSKKPWETHPTLDMRIERIMSRGNV